MSEWNKEITFESLLDKNSVQLLTEAVIEYALDVVKETGLSIDQLRWDFFEETSEHTQEGLIVGCKARLVPINRPPEVDGK